MRIKKLQEKLPENTSYLVNSPIDIYYLTGLDLSAGSLVIGKNSFLIVDGRYYEACREKCPVPVHLIKEGLLFELVEDTLWVDKDSLTVGAFLKLQADAKGMLIQPVDSLVKPLRMIKDPKEIKLLKEASNLAVEGFHYVKSLLKAGVEEREIRSELEYFWRKKGGEKVSFDPIIAFGLHSSMPHYRAGKGKLKEGDLVLIDIGVEKEHYHSDMTRVVPFGAIPEQLKTLHQVVQEAIETALTRLKSGILLKEIDESARKVMRKAGYEEYFTHSLGHGIGLEIHEYPLIKSQGPSSTVPLQEGMVVTIEPGLYLPAVGGVRLEDTVVITNEGYENLTPIPYE